VKHRPMLQIRPMPPATGRQLRGYTRTDLMPSHPMITVILGSTLIGGLATSILLGRMNPELVTFGFILGGLCCLIIATAISVFAAAQTRKARRAHDLDANDEDDPDIIAN
jgi:hypothetical protein